MERGVEGGRGSWGEEGEEGVERGCPRRDREVCNSCAQAVEENEVGCGGVEVWSMQSGNEASCVALTHSIMLPFARTRAVCRRATRNRRTEQRPSVLE